MKKLIIILMLLLPTQLIAGSSNWDELILDEDIWYPENFTMTLSQSQINLSEGGASVEYTVVPDIEPVHDPVTVTITGPSQITVIPSTLTFSPNDWNTKTIQISAIDNDFVEQGQNFTISHSVRGEETDYVHLDLTLQVKVTDDDIANINLSKSEINVTENGINDEYFVSLTSQPRDNVSLEITYDDQITTSLQNLTFTTDNWKTLQKITVSAKDDLMDEEPFAIRIIHPFKSRELFGSYSLNIGSWTSCISFSKSVTS